MDGWMDESIDGWMGGWMDGWMNRWMDGWVNGWTNIWMDGWVDGWMGEWTNGYTCHTYSDIKLKISNMGIMNCKSYRHDLKKEGRSILIIELMNLVKDQLYEVIIN